MSYILYALLSIASIYLEPITLALFGVSFILVVWIVSSSMSLKLPVAMFALISSILIDITFKYPVGLQLSVLVLYFLIYSVISNLLPDDSFIIRFFKIYIPVTITQFLFLVIKNGVFDITFLLSSLITGLTTTIISLILIYLVSLFQSGADTSGFRLKI